MSKDSIYKPYHDVLYRKHAETIILQNTLGSFEEQFGNSDKFKELKHKADIEAALIKDILRESINEQNTLTYLEP